MVLRTYFVEDNSTIRNNLIETLEELADVSSLGFADAERPARDWLRDHSLAWDLLIVDLFLRDGSGIGVLQSCQSRLPGQRVVVLSNYATPDVRVRCLQMGADRIFDKSTEIESLIAYCLSQQARDGATS